jgi:hypothetical protein
MFNWFSWYWASVLLAGYDNWRIIGEILNFRAGRGLRKKDKIRKKNFLPDLSKV